VWLAVLKNKKEAPFMKKYLALFLSVALTVTALCVPAMAEEDNRPEISVAILDRSAVPADQGTYEDNWATRWINENSPVKVNFVAVPRGQTYQQYNLLLASGEAPDVIMEFQPQYVEEWANQGMLTELSSIIDEYAPNYRALTPAETQQWGVYNGGEYAFAQQRFEEGVINHMVYIRTDWLENLGLSMPTNEEEFLNVVRAFTEDDPDGNGVDDTWGWSMAGHYQTAIQSIYGVNGDEWYKTADGTFENANLMEERLQAMKLLETLVDNGWCDKEWLSYDGETQYTHFATGKTGFLACEHSNLPNKAWETLMQNFPTAKVAPMPSWTQYGYYQERECQFLSCVPTTCDNPEAVAQYIDWMITDGWQMLKWGEEGVDFENRDGLYVSLLTPEENTAKLAYTGEYAIVCPYGMSAELFKQSKEALDDSNARKGGFLIDADAVLATRDIKYRRDTPTSNLGVDIVVEYMPDMYTVSKECWAKALADVDYTSEQAQADIKAEWENMDYEMVKEAFNEKAAELGL
jgi:putative aldouronate transport system substrate-binding protein